jgi:hypothetical protein
LHVAECLVEAPLRVVRASSAPVAAAHGRGLLRIAGGAGGEQPIKSCSSPDLAAYLPIRSCMYSLFIPWSVSMRDGAQRLERARAKQSGRHSRGTYL